MSCIMQISTSKGMTTENDGKCPSRQKQVYNRRTVQTALSPTMTTTGVQSGPCQLGLQSAAHVLRSVLVMGYAT